MGVLKKTQNVVLVHQRERERTNKTKPFIQYATWAKKCKFWILNEKSAPIVSLLYDRPQTEWPIVIGIN